MVKAQYIHKGDAVDYTPTVDTPAGSVVVQGELVGITKLDILANVLGALAVTGVFDIVKATGAATAIAAGANCYWNATTQQVTTTAAGNKLLGHCIRAAVDTDETVRIRLSQ